MKTALRANRATRDLVKTTGIKRPESQQNLDVFGGSFKEIPLFGKMEPKVMPKNQRFSFFSDWTRFRWAHFDAHFVGACGGWDSYLFFQFALALSDLIRNFVVLVGKLPVFLGL